MIKIKKGILNEDEALLLANKVDNDTKAIKDFYLLSNDIIDKKGINVLDKVKYNILKCKFSEDINK